ncbi:MAG TPA: BlaI/MecI/CopY family transcriptional regulator [Bacteroidales bacterium]|nr:BlaI/MecI/CopY family transcriptional regulator [Bacteroidales bacterium]
MKEITKAQEDILQALWQINDGAVSDVLDILPEPKPAYNTVATVIKVLEKKGYVSHKTYGKTNVYYPLVSKQDYARNVLKNSVKGLFNGSFKQAVSFFVRENKEVSLAELEELRNYIEEEIKNKKN